MLFNLLQSNSSSLLKLSRHVSCFIRPDGCLQFSLPMRIHQSLHNTHWCLDETTCVFWIWVDLACRCTCFANLALISLDRFVATRYPLRYHRIITQRRGHLMILYIWFHGGAIASLGLNNWTNPTIPAFAIDNPSGCRKTPDPTFYTFAACVGFFLPLLIITASYSYVFSVSLEHWKSTNCRTLPSRPSHLFRVASPVDDLH